MANENKINPTLKDRVLEVKVTTLEGALLKRLRDLDYGKFSIVVHKIEGQPIRIEVTEISGSYVLQAREGLDLEDSLYIGDPINKINL